MSVSALPEWKQLLLERKRREEEERERREREEEERLASMPAWKRGIIQRRRAKQDGAGEREREREGEATQQGFTSRNLDGYYDDHPTLRQSDAEMEVTSEGTHSRVSVETIGPIRQNPFIRSQNSYRRENRRREAGRGNHGKGKEAGGEENMGEMERDTKAEEFWRGRDRGMRMEKTRDRSEGRETKDRERDAGRGKREGERDGGCLSLSPSLRSIKAENIIIIEKDGKPSEREAQREVREGERPAARGEKKGMRMDLREILACGGNVTEIRASEVLIIKPSVTEGEQVDERRSSKENVPVVDKGREGRMEKEKARDWDGVMKEEGEVWPKSPINMKNDSSLGSGRVRHILSKFGQQPKPPCRSKSNDCFIRPGKDSLRVRLTYGPDEGRREETGNDGFRGVPKRSYSFSEQVVSEDRKVVERASSDRRRPPPPAVITPSESAGPGTGRQGRVKTEHQLVMQRKSELEGEVEREGRGQGSGGEVFSTASVRNPEDVPFARRIPIRLDRKELKRLQVKRGVERGSVGRREKERVEEMEMEMELEMEMEMEMEMKMVQREPEKGWHMESDVEEKAEPIKVRRDGEEVTVVMESVMSFCSYTLESHRWSNSHTASDHKTESQHPAIASVTQTLPAVRPKNEDADFFRQENQTEHHVVPPHRDTRDTLETRDDKHVEPKRESDTPGKEMEKSGILQEPEHRGRANTHGQCPALRAEETEPSAPKTPKHASWTAGAGQEIHIPRSVFFGMEELAEGHEPGILPDDGPIAERGHGKAVERRESWKAGRPLTRVESLREKIRQREMERQRREEAEGEGGREAGRSEGEGMERGEGGERRREAEGALRSVMVNRQEVALPQTLSLLDVAEEASSVSNASPQLPASVPLLLLRPASAGREAPQLGQRFLEQDEESRHQQDSGSLKRAPGEEGETEEDLLEDQYLCPSHSPSPPGSLSPSPSPPLPNSLAAMSRIYNLKTVGSRTAVCISERNSEVPSHSKKVFPEGRFTSLSHAVTQAPVSPQDRATLGSDRTGRDGHSALTTETSAVLSVQRQVGQLQLREQEVKQSSHGNTDAQCVPQKEIGRKTADTHTSTPVGSRASPSQQTGTRIPTKLPQPRSFTINGQNAQPPENLQKPPPSSPSSPSSSSLSPSLSPSRPTPLFSIRSASGGPGKRGTTITITPRRPAAGISAAPAPTGTSAKPESPVPEPSIKDEGRKKRYPTAEEIEVIGGYQNLENSCLVKNRGSPKGVTVRFEPQLEQVCVYPSEDSLLASLPASGEEQGSEEGRQAEGDDGPEEEEDEEDGGFVSGGAKSLGTSTRAARVIRVDESCRR